MLRLTACPAGALLKGPPRGIPARLQRVRDFPSQLKDYTLQQIEQMLFSKDFSIATQEQLKMAQKLIRQQPRLMEKY